MKKQKGITLIALVITIIVLLILAGVTIALVIGDNGILTQATEAVKKNRQAQAIEDVAMAWTSVDTDYWADWTNDTSVIKEDYFKPTELNEYLEGKGVVKDEPFEYLQKGVSTLYYVPDANKEITYYMKIDKNGKVTIISETVGDSNVEKHEGRIPVGAAYKRTIIRNELEYNYNPGDEFPALKMNGDVYEYNGYIYTLKNRTGNDLGAENLDDAREGIKQLLIKIENVNSWSEVLDKVEMTEDDVWIEFGLTADKFVPASGGVWRVVASDSNDVLKKINGLEVVIDKGTYYVGVTSDTFGKYTGATATYTNGEFPETVSTGDIFVLGDYEYRYNCYCYFSSELGKLRWSFNHSQNGWGVRCIDTDLSSYDSILETIHGKPVSNLDNTFRENSSLVSAPVIPSSVTSMRFTFFGCGFLTGEVIINANPTFYEYCFATNHGWPDKNITLTGSSTKLQELANTSSAGNRIVYDANGNILKQ